MLKYNESISSKYWNKLAKIKKFVSVKRIPEKALLPIINSNYTYPTKIKMLENLSKEYNIIL